MISLLSVGVVVFIIAILLAGYVYNLKHMRYKSVYAGSILALGLVFSFYTVFEYRRMSYVNHKSEAALIQAEFNSDAKQVCSGNISHIRLYYVSFFRESVANIAKESIAESADIAIDLYPKTDMDSINQLCSHMMKSRLYGAEFEGDGFDARRGLIVYGENKAPLFSLYSEGVGVGYLNEIQVVYPWKIDSWIRNSCVEHTGRHSWYFIL